MDKKELFKGPHGVVLDYDMTPRRRELYLRIVDNYDSFHEVTNRLFFLDAHFPPNKLDRALTWLVASGHVGAKLVNWFKEECKSSDLEMHRLLLSIVDNLEVGPVVAGRNFKV